MKICLFMPIWKRPGILKICLDRLEKTLPPYAELIPVFVISREDKYFDINLKLIEKYDYLIYKNNPFGEKKNAGLHYALRSDWDYLMELNSDSVFTKELWDYYEPYFGKSEFFGLRNLYFLDTVNNKAVFLRDYAYDHNDKPFAYGAGRVMSRKVCEEVKEMWRPDWNISMDGCSRYNILDAGFDEDVIETGEDPIMLNMVSFYNINPFSAAEEMREKYVDTDWLKKEFGLTEYEDGRVNLLSIDNFHREVLKRQQNTSQKDAFNEVNYIYRDTFGVLRYKNYNTYQAAISRKMKHGR